MSTMPKIWDDSVVRDYLTPEAHQKSREQFLKTHLDIDKIRADYLFPHEGTDEFVTQEEFRDAILKSKIDDDNRIFILRGETGSGKSQLCQWLEYQIDAEPDEGDETHIALHVSRSKTGIGDILDIISGPVDTDVTVSNVSDLDPQKVADAIITTLRAFGLGMEQFGEDEIEALTAERPNTTDLWTILDRNIAEYQESAMSEGKKRMSDLITKKDYRDLSMAAFGSTKGADTLFPALQSQVHEILSRNLGVEDFQGKLEELSEEYEDRGLRPVLICEDLTTFTVLKEQLLDHIFQLDSGHYDVVLGWTSGWEKDDLSRALGTSQGISTYMEDRAEGYLSTTDEDGRAYFLDDLTVKLARRYMSTIIEESDTNESLHDGVLESFDSLYPFNETFIEESYNHLIQDGNKRRTPRLLLMRVVRECLSSTVPPFDAIEDNPFVEPFPSSVDLSYSESIQRLGKWYGSATTDRRLRVHRQIPETFDVPLTDVDVGDDLVYFQADVPAPTLNLVVSEGTYHPSEYITLRATLDSRGEEGVTIRFNGSEVATTDSDGLASVRLPDEKGDVTFQAEKGGETDATTVTVVEPTDDTSISVTVNPKTPTVSDEVTVTVRVNGEPRSGVQVSVDDAELGETRGSGKIRFNALDGESATVEAVYGDARDETTIDIESSDIHVPVGTDLDSTTVKEYLLQYRNWIKVGDTYNSSTVLREGAGGVLKEWHDPTLLGNLNARNDGVHGIYYTRGGNIPVTIVGADERQGLSFDLDFGVEYDDIYEPLFWYGISESGEFPQEDKYDLNYDLLRAWTDKQVADFRAEMRADLEACIDPMTLEQFTVLAQFLILNATTSRREVEADMMFEKLPQQGERFIPGLEDEQPTELQDATNDLLKSRNAPYNLAQGLFLIKSNVVDRERLSKAVESVSANLDQYLLQAMQFDSAYLSSAYQISTTRSKEYDVNDLFERVKDYATTLDDVSAEQNAAHVTENIETVTTYYEPNHDRDDLHDALTRLHDILDKLDASKYESWREAREAVAGDAEIDLGRFRQRMRTFEDISDKQGYELIATLHDYEESRAAESAWEIYEAIAEMIGEAECVKLPEDVGFRDRVRDRSAFETYEQRRNAIETTLGGN